MQLVADVVNGHHHGDWGPPRRRVSRRVDDVDGCAARRTRQANERPAQIGRRVRRLRDVSDARGDRARIAPPERDELNRLVERQQSAGQTGNVSPYSGRGRVERAAIDADSKGRQMD